jgi:hypothetical protein
LGLRKLARKCKSRPSLTDLIDEPAGGGQPATDLQQASRLGYDWPPVPPEVLVPPELSELPDMPEELDDPPLVLLAPRDRVADLPWLFLEWALAPDRRLLVALAPDPPDPLLMPVEDPDCPPDDVPPLV